MKWIYIAVGIVLYIKALILPNPLSELSFSIVDAVAKDSGVLNAVSGTILKNRLYDTIFEVIVFTIAIMGAYFLLANEKPCEQGYQLHDPASIVLARLGATITALVGLELAIRGHLSPGGGFAAGVAGGTAIGLVALTASPEWMQALYQRWHTAIWEKISVLLFIVLSVMTLAGWELPHGQVGTLFSGGIVPILNILVAVKVALGSWAVILAFIKYRRVV